jgi:hypothetical protein
VRVRTGWLWGLVGWLWSALGAQADAGVLLREQAELRPGLCGALRIQLSGVADVQCEPEDEAAPLPARIATTATRLRERGALLGVLLERDPDPGLLRMYLVSARADQAVIAIERIEDRPEPDVDRSLALKVGDAYQAIELVRAAVPQLAQPLAAAISAPPPARPLGSWQLFLDVGGGPHVDESGWRGLANVVLGAGYAGPALRVEVGAGARFDSLAEPENELGRLSLRERGGLVGMRLLWRGARFEFGGVLEGLLLSISAQAYGETGGQQETSFFTPALGLGADLRVRLFGTAFLRAAPMLELLRSERVTLYDQGPPIAQTGPARLAVPLSLLINLPL